MITASDILAKELLATFFFDDPRIWRYRQVTQITPLTNESYRARTSYQFKFNRTLITSIWRTALGNLEPAPSLKEDLDLIVPIDYLPKYVLLDFSLLDSAGKPLALLSSGDINQLSFEIVRLAMNLLDVRCGDQATTAMDFFVRNHDIIFALISTGQGEIATRLGSVDALKHRPGWYLDYSVDMMRFYSEALSPHASQGLPPRLCDILWEHFRQAFLAIDGAGDELQALVGGGNGYPDPLLNPLLLIAEGMKMVVVGAPVASEVLIDHVDNFASSARQFLGDLLQLTSDEKRFFPLLAVLSRFSRYYVAYARMNVPQDRDFIVKMEQVIPAGRDWPWRSLWNAIRHRNFQWYPLKIGDTRSTHVEVSCEHPIELEQVPQGARVRRDGRVVAATTIFGRGSYETEYHQHFYTNKSSDEIARALGVGDDVAAPRSTHDFELGIRYAVETTTVWGYRLVAVTVSAALLFLVATYEPSKLRTGQPTFLPILPVLFALFGALASLRPQEGIVAIRMKKYKKIVLAMAGAMAVYFGFGLVWPPSIEWIRTWLRTIGLNQFLVS